SVDQQPTKAKGLFGHGPPPPAWPRPAARGQRDAANPKGIRPVEKHYPTAIVEQQTTKAKGLFCYEPTPIRMAADNSKGPARRSQFATLTHTKKPGVGNDDLLVEIRSASCREREQPPQGGGRAKKRGQRDTTQPNATRTHRKQPP